MNLALIPNTSWIDLLNELVGVGNLWDAAELHLYKAPIAIAPSMALADFIAAECDFSGYSVTTKLITWLAAAYSIAGTPQVIGDTHVYNVASPATVLNTVYGLFVTTTAHGALLFAKAFDTPLVLATALQQFEVIPAYSVALSV